MLLNIQKKKQELQIIYTVWISYTTSITCSHFLTTMLPLSDAFITMKQAWQNNTTSSDISTQ